MSPQLEDRLDAYRAVLENAMAAGPLRASASPKRRWQVVRPLLLCVTATFGLLVLVTLRSSDRDGQVQAPSPMLGRATDSSPRTTSVTTGPITSTAAESTDSGTRALIPYTLAIGDSVMLGARRQLTDAGVVVNAEVARQLADAIPLVQGLGDAGRLPEQLILHLGSNGPIEDNTLVALLGLIRDVDNVVVLTGRSTRPWVSANNEKILALPARYQNVTVLDWSALAERCDPECVLDDGGNLSPAGQDYYAGTIIAEVDAFEGISPQSTTVDGG